MERGIAIPEASRMDGLATRGVAIEGSGAERGTRMALAVLSCWSQNNIGQYGDSKLIGRVLKKV